jgi:hypothetical protein
VNNRTLTEAEGKEANDSSWDVSPEPGLRLLVKESAKLEMVARNTSGAASGVQILNAADYTACIRGCSMKEKSVGI